MADIFDALLVSTLSVLERTPGAGDAYGLAPTNFTTLATDIPCRVSTKATGRAKEFKSGKKTALNYRKIFMRPWFDGDNNPLTHDHWLQIGSQLFDILQIDALQIDSTGIPHHLEVWVEEIQP